jgi:type IV pilus assembly protein PilN
MARINLLPWREERRDRRKKELAVMAGVGVAATVLIMGLWHMVNQSMIDGQIERNAILKKEIQLVDSKLLAIKDLDKKRAELEERMGLIQSLQESRPESVHLMDELVFIIPDGLRLTAINQKGTSIELEGWAQSNAQVSSLMRNVEDSPWLEKPSLQLIQTKDQSSNRRGENSANLDGLSSFKLSMQQTRPKEAQQ